MSTPAKEVFPSLMRWETEGSSRIPFMAYTGEDLHKKELERFFYRQHWNYVGLEAEVPNVGDFKRTVVGERSVIMVRDASGIQVVENVCAHRGMQFCRERHGNKKDFVCPYHQWSYTLQGDLQGVPFRRGVKQDGKINGGMPADFQTADHGLSAVSAHRARALVGRAHSGHDDGVSQRHLSAAGQQRLHAAHPAGRAWGLRFRMDTLRV